METTHRSKFIQSSNLLFITAGLVILSNIFSRLFIPDETNSLFLIIMNLFVICSVGLIVRQGKIRTKYLPLGLLILFFIEASSFLIHQDVHLALKIIFVAQLILVALATFILFFDFQKTNVKNRMA